jgi:hypothetical protein
MIVTEVSFLKNATDKIIMNIQLLAEPFKRHFLLFQIFPYSGGPMFGTETIGKHKETPFVTDTKININQICKGEILF